MLLVSILVWYLVIGVCFSDCASASTNDGRADNNIRFDNFRKLVDSPEAKKHDQKKMNADLTLIQELTLVDTYVEGEVNRKSKESQEQTKQLTMKETETMKEAEGEIKKDDQKKMNDDLALTQEITVAGTNVKSEVNSRKSEGSLEQTNQLTMKKAEGEIRIQELQTDNNNTVITSFSAATLSFSACEKLNMALELMTSLDFQEHFQKVFSFTKSYGPEMQASESDFYNYVYILQIIFTPIFISLLLFGANLFLYTFVVCAAAIGLFAVFDGVEGVFPIQLDCPMKLTLSVIASFICALIAKKFFRVGLFAFGSLALGGATYVIFDTFPHLDPGTIIFTPNNAVITIEVETPLSLPTSDLSTIAWIITIFFSIIGGIMLRYFEMALLEIMTAGMGGVGCAYSLHTFFMVQGMPLDPSIVFLLAFFISLFGWKFQRRHRHVGVLQQQFTEKGGAAIPWHPIEQQKQLEESMRSLLDSQQNQKKQDGPSSEQISKLTETINSLMHAMEEGKKQEENKDNQEKDL